MRFAILLTLSCCLLQADRKVISLPDAKPIGPYSPAVLAGDFLYLSGQGPLAPDGTFPQPFEQQVQRTLENLRQVLEAAKLTPGHVVLTTIYLTNVKQRDAMDKVYAKFFGENAPARAVVGVSRLPRGIAVEINAVAVRDTSLRKAIRNPAAKMTVAATPAVEAGDRVFLTSTLGRTARGEVPKSARAQVETMLEQSRAALKTVNLEPRNLAFAIVYVTPQMNRKVLEDLLTELMPSETARTVVQTDSLPEGAQIALSGLATRSFRRMGRCNQIGDTLYCTGRSGTIRQVLNEVKADLHAAQSDLTHVAHVTVAMSNMDQFAEMNKVYSEFFTKDHPARTTVQPWKSVTELALAPATGAEAKPDDSPRAEVIVIAVKPKQ